MAELEKIALDSAAFARALREGRGAALMHVRAHGLADVVQAVLSACLEEQAYDAQCEGHRAAWLYLMFKDAPEYDLFHRRFIAEFADMSEDTSVEQLCELASLMALDGDTEMARRYGRMLLADPKAFVDSLDALTDENQEAYAAAFAGLSTLAAMDPAVAAYMVAEQDRIDDRLREGQRGEAEKAARKEWRRTQVLGEFPVDKILAAAKERDNARGKFLRFGKWSDEAGLTAVLRQLEVEEDPEVCLRLLWVFCRTTPPFMAERLRSLAMHPDARLRHAAWDAWRHVDDPQVAEFGRQYLRNSIAGAEDAVVIELRSKHPQAGDEALILNTLERLHPSATQAHDIGMSILRYCEERRAPSTVDILHWLYRTNPCTICRCDAVKLMVETNCLPARIALECQFDARGATRDLMCRHNG